MIRNRRWWLPVLVGVALLALWLLVRPRPPSRLPPSPAPAAVAARPDPSRNRLVYRASAEVPAVTAQARAPVIDDVAVEKREVCEGEENLVTIQAHTPGNADDAFLHYLIGGNAGGSAVVRASAEPGALDGMKAIAFGRNGVSASAAVPPFTVKDCKVDHQLLLSVRLLPNRAAEFELAARIQRFGAREAFQPARYLWSFGDGSTAQTSAPVVTHDFSRRPQQAMVSTFLIACVAVSQAGQKVAGRTTLALDNLAFESFAYKGVVKILIDLEPRFPALGEDGVVTQRAQLWHPYARPVRIERLRRTKLVIGAVAGPPEELPASLLGVTVIDPGETAVSKALTLDTNADANVYSVEYLVEGTTEDGWPASGNFALMRPPAPPTRQNSTPVVDPTLKARILRTRELLGKELVTDEDIWRLEREGRLDGLAVDAQPGPPPAAPSRPRPAAPGSPR
jgi:hypothetical protein